MIHVRAPYRLAIALSLVFVVGCGSGAPPVPPPLPQLPAGKEAPKVKKGAKQKGPADSELDPDSGIRTRRRLRKDAASKAE